MPPGIATLNAEVTAKPARQSAGQDARLYGRRDARRCANYIRTRRGHRSVMSNQDGLCFHSSDATGFPFRPFLAKPCEGGVGGNEVHLRSNGIAALPGCACPKFAEAGA